MIHVCRRRNPSLHCSTVAVFSGNLFVQYQGHSTSSDHEYVDAIETLHVSLPSSRGYERKGTGTYRTIRRILGLLYIVKWFLLSRIQNLLLPLQSKISSTFHDTKFTYAYKTRQRQTNHQTTFPYRSFVLTHNLPLTHFSLKVNGALPGMCINIRMPVCPLEGIPKSETGQKEFLDDLQEDRARS